MSFWSLSDGEEVKKQETFEAPSGGGDYIFADNSKVSAVIEEAKWVSFDGGERFVNLRWSVLAPEKDADGVKIANRKVFQKIYPQGDIEHTKTEEKRKKKSDTAKRMLGAIASNAGGGLLTLGREPTDEDFAQHLLMKPMTIMLKTWEMDGKKGNWVCAVGPAESGLVVAGGARAERQDKLQTQQQSGGYDDDVIPF